MIFHIKFAHIYVQLKYPLSLAIRSVTANKIQNIFVQYVYITSKTKTLLIPLCLCYLETKKLYTIHIIQLYKINQSVIYINDISAHKTALKSLHPEHL